MLNRTYRICYTITEDGKKIRVIDLTGLLQSEKDFVFKSHSHIEFPTVYMDENGYLDFNGMANTVITPMFDCENINLAMY